jgi:hypothetical protein
MEWRLFQTGDRPEACAALTRAQKRFAKSVAATPGMWCEESVILYHEEPTLTHRWIVDGDGYIIDEQFFHHRPRWTSSSPSAQASASTVRGTARSAITDHGISCRHEHCHRPNDHRR